MEQPATMALMASRRGLLESGVGGEEEVRLRKAESVAEVKAPPQVLMIKGRPGVLCQSRSSGLEMVVELGLEEVRGCWDFGEARVGVVVVKRARRGSMDIRGTRVDGGVMIDAGMTAGKSEEVKREVRLEHSMKTTG